MLETHSILPQSARVDTPDLCLEKKQDIIRINLKMLKIPTVSII